jgi:hypothetical protein
MLQKIADFFWRIAGLKTFIAALLIYIVFAGYVMPHGAQRIQEISGKKVEILDLQFTYTPEKAKGIIAEYGETGRDCAAKFELIGDTLYPVAYTFLFLIIMGWLFKSLAAYGFKIRLIHLFPLLIIMADYNENACIIRMLKNYPGFSDELVNLSSFFTSLKWCLLAAQTFIIGIALWLLTFYKMTRGKVLRSQPQD